MEYRKIGSLEVSVVGLGCSNFGRQTDERQSADVVHAALEAGINFFDTADVYGHHMSEGILGKALSGRREEAVIASKFGVMRVGQDLEKGILDPHSERVSPLGHGGGDPGYVRVAVENSLHQLGIDHIDLIQ